MPRKTKLKAQAQASTCGFNEAAARCRGKRGPDRTGFCSSSVASMRPRPDAAENEVVPQIDLAAAGMLQ